MDIPIPADFEAGAEFSPCLTYRYRLWRRWDRSLPVLCFVAMNPSTADIRTNDPTVERLQRRAVQTGFGGLEVANVFALRSTDPMGLYRIDDPVGPGNDMAIVSACNAADLVVCAWGKHGNYRGRGDAVRSLLSSACNKPLHVLGLNGDGTPKHPLYIKYAVMPVLWQGCGV